MRLRKEDFHAGQYYHLYNHSIPEINLFRDKEDYHNCLFRFKRKIKVYPASVIAYCLMPNHYHFLLRQEADEPIYRIFNDVFAGYTQYYNKKYTRKGALFQNKLQHKLIDKQEYLITICRYIHLNPLKANLVKNLDEWKYSNYLEWIGKRKGVLFDQDILNGIFHHSTYYQRTINEFFAEEIKDYLFD